MKPITRGKRVEAIQPRGDAPANPHDTPPRVDAERLWAERDAEGLTFEEVGEMAAQSAEEARRRANEKGAYRAGRLPDIALEALQAAGRRP